MHTEGKGPLKKGASIGRPGGVNSPGNLNQRGAQGGGGKHPKIALFRGCRARPNEKTNKAEAKDRRATGVLKGKIGKGKTLVSRTKHREEGGYWGKIMRGTPKKPRPWTRRERQVEKKKTGR